MDPRIGFLFFLFLVLSCHKAEKDTQTMDISDEINIPKNYTAFYISSPLDIDGNMEDDWEKAPFSDFFIDISGNNEEIPYSTQFKMLWDSSFLYVYAYLEEPHVWADLKNRDDIIFYNNDFEVFIDSDPSNPVYAEFEINALNTVWDLLLTKPYRARGNAIDLWNSNDLKTAVKIDGTLNDNSDADQGWAVEMAIPFISLLDVDNTKKRHPSPGDVWRMNFSRVEWQYEINNGVYQRKKKGDKHEHEENWVWSPQWVVNMHQPDRWGFVKFTENTEESFDLETDAADFIDEQILFALYRKSLSKEIPSQYPKEIGQKADIKIVFDEKESKTVSAMKTFSGFQFQMNSSNKLININEEGLIKKNHEK